MSSPTTIGKYRIEREIGRGASSVVYLALDSFYGRQVAIKQTHAHLLHDEQQADRYRRQLHNEALLAGRLKHPHIVRLIDADEEATPPYLVLEYIDGVPLSAFTSPQRLLPVPQVLDIAFKVCRALEHAHSKGMVHRDIKPANLILQANGDVKVTDFGMALALHSDATQVMGLVGSPSYMSPEQVRDESCTFHSDMFSLGSVTYELLTGRRAFEGETDFATLYKIATDEPPPATLLRKDLPRTIDKLLGRAMAKRPQDRFVDWSAFADAILAISRAVPAGRTEQREGERFAQLRGLDFFSGFHDAAIWELLRLASIKRGERGAVLMREGEPGESFYVLLEGRVGVSRNGLKLFVLEPGVTLGEMAFLQPGNPVRSATAVAETDVVTLKISNAALRSASEELQACFDKAFIRLLVNRLISTTEQLGNWDVGAAAKR